MSKSSFGALNAGRPSERNKSKLLDALRDDAPETVRINFEATEAQRTKLKIAAAKQNVTVKDLLTGFIDSLGDDA